MSRLLLVRHGQTDWNVQGRIQGQHDTSLTEIGAKQARDLRDRLASEPLAGVFSSDLKRAFETASIIAEPFSLTVQRDSKLRERSYGLLEGHFVKDYPDIFSGQSIIPTNLAVQYGIETEDFLFMRATTAIEILLRQHPGQTICAVTHGGLIFSYLQGAFSNRFSNLRLNQITNTCLLGIERTTDGLAITTISGVN